MKRYNYFICKNSQPVFSRSAGAGGGLQYSRVSEGCNTEERTSRRLSLAATNVMARVFTACIYWTKLMQADWGGCGGLRLCNRSSSTMWLSDAPPPSEKRVTQDTRTKTCNLVLGLLLSPYLSPATIIKPLLPGGVGLSYRQPESGGSPISFVHFPTSFSAVPILPPG